MWQRRAFIRAAGASFVAGLMPRAALALEASDLVFASAIQQSAGKFAAALVTETGSVLATIDLPDRGHDITFSPEAGRAVVFARQPGTFAVVFDPKGQAAPVTLTSSEGRHFFGHGVFSPDGRLLYATENDFDRARGVIGIFDATDGYRRIGEFDTHGTGPHEMLLMPDGETLVVANGGIETHPDFGRAELNLDTMDPSIAFIERASGALVGQLRLDAGLFQLSIRHMAVDAQGKVWFGCQFRGADSERPQLVGHATRDGQIRLIDLPGDVLAGMRNYIGSVAVSRDGETIGVSSPEGDRLLALSARDGRVLADRRLKSGCGIAADARGLVATSGEGAMEGLIDADIRAQRFGFGFDNHLLAVQL